MKHTYLSSGVVAALAFALGCGGPSRPAPAAPVTSVPDETGPDPAPVADDDAPDLVVTGAATPPADVRPAPIVTQPIAPTVTLLKPGKGKRALLRFANQPSYACALAMDMQVEVSGVSMTTPTMVMRWRGSATGGDGDVIIMHDVFDGTELRPNAAANLPPEGVAALEQAMASLEGMVMDTTMTNRGIVTTSSVQPQRAVDPTMLDSLGNAISGLVFPVEPVGIGARWQVDREQVQQNIRSVYRTVYELVSRKGATTTVKATVSYTGKSEPSAPMPVTMAGAGSGQLVYTGGPCPSSAIDLTSESTTNGTPFMKMTLRSVVTPGPAPATVAP